MARTVVGQGANCLQEMYEGRIFKTNANTIPTADVDIRVRVRGGGHTSQIYAIRQAISKSIVSSPPIS